MEAVNDHHGCWHHKKTDQGTLCPLWGKCTTARCSFDRSSSKIKTDETLMKHQDPPTPSQEYRGKECVTWSTEISNIQAMGEREGNYKGITSKGDLRDRSANSNETWFKHTNWIKKYGIYETSGNVNTGLVFNNIKELKLIL